MSTFEAVKSRPGHQSLPPHALFDLSRQPLAVEPPNPHTSHAPDHVHRSSAELDAHVKHKARANPQPAGAHLQKRATYDPRYLAQSEKPPQPNPLSWSSEYVLHPAIAAYQQAHPRRALVNFGPYILLQTLGEGEFGKVKLGIHKDYGEEVAVKLIRRGSVDNHLRLSKVEREIEVLKVCIDLAQSYAMC